MNEFKINFELPSEYFQDELLKVVDEYCINQVNGNDFEYEKEYNLALINESKDASICYPTRNVYLNIPVSFKNYRSEHFDKSEYILYLINKEKEIKDVK